MAADTPAEWDDFVAPLEDANERLGRAWGQVSHLHAVMDARAARGLQRQPAQDHRRTTPSCRRTRRCSTNSRRCKASPDFAALSAPRRERSSTTSCAISASAAPSCPTTRSRASRQIQEELVAAVGQVRGKPARRDQRISRCSSTTKPNWPAFPTMRCRRRAKRRQKRRQAGLEIHPAHAVLPAGDAVRRQPRPARADVPRLRHPRLRVRQARAGTTRR